MRTVRQLCARGFEGVMALALGAGAASCGRIGYEPVDEHVPPAFRRDGGANTGGATASEGGPASDAARDSAIARDAAAVTDAAIAKDAGDATSAGWAFKKAVVVAGDAFVTDASGVVAADMIDFPLLVSVPADPDLAARVASPDGRDIRFTASDGSQLDHEIELFDAAKGQLVAWVRVPVLFATVPTQLYLEYGNPTATNQQNARGVWESRYVSVWHLAQSPGPGGLDQIIDSAGNSPGTASSAMQDDDLVPGRIGHAIDFNGIDDEIRFSNKFTGTGAHTISAWVNQRATTGVDAIVAFGSDTQNQARWLYSSFGANSQVAVGFYTNDLTSQTDIRGSGFTHLVWTYDGSTSRLYVNGALAQSHAHTGADTVGTNGWIGNVFVPGAKGFGPDQHLDGQLDEIRVFAGVLGAGRIRAEYDNQVSPATFVTLGPEQAQ